MEPLSEQRLLLVNPTLAEKVRAAADQLAAEGTYFRVAQGLRSYAEQYALYAQGRTRPGHIVTNAQGGYSNHNFGLAVDCYPFLSGVDGELNWDATTPQFQAMVNALRAQGLAWGGTWLHMTDPPHFQLKNVPVTPTPDDRQAYYEGGLQQVWSLYGYPDSPAATLQT